MQTYRVQVPNKQVREFDTYADAYGWADSVTETKIRKKTKIQIVTPEKTMTFVGV